MSRRITCEEIVPTGRTVIGSYDFACSLCGRTVHRGGHAEGFRKSGMSHHVHACWEILLYLRGYLIGKYRRTKPWGHFAVKIEDAHPAWGERYVRSIKANIRRREKDGEMGRLRELFNRLPPITPR